MSAVIPLPTVAIAFSVVALFCLVDAFVAPLNFRRYFRFFQFLAFAAGAYNYWQAAYLQHSIPSPNIRITLLVIAVVTVSEIISRWPLMAIWGKR